MFGSKDNWYVEFLAESNIALNQDDERVQMDSVISPIKQFLQEKNRPITAYILARSNGAPSQLAFFCELANFTGQVMQNLATLSDYNFDILMSSLRQADRENLEVIARVQELSQGQLLTMQIAFLNQKLEQFRLDSFARYPFMSRFLSAQRFQKVFSNEQLVTRTLASNKTTLSQYLDVLASGFTYYTVVLPVLSGIASSLKDQEDVIDSQQVQWSMIESVLVNISLLVRTAHTTPLALFLKEQVTSDKLEWFVAPLTIRIDLAMSDTEIEAQIASIRGKVLERTVADLESLILPESLKITIKNLLEWSRILKLELNEE